jgi:lysophospholipase L1-like esterase
MMIVNDLILSRHPAQYALYYGDSKTEAGQYQTALTQLANVSGVNLGVGARTAATGATEIAAELATLTYTPDKILFNLGANDVAALPAEATWKADMGTILDAMNAKWPSAQIYIMRPWKRDEAADCNSLATWIGDIVTARSTYCHLGPDERVFLEGGDDGATYTADGIHPNAAGYTLTANQWISVAGL